MSRLEQLERDHLGHVEEVKEKKKSQLDDIFALLDESITVVEKANDNERGLIFRERMNTIIALIRLSIIRDDKQSLILNRLADVIKLICSREIGTESAEKIDRIGPLSMSDRDGDGDDEPEDEKQSSKLSTVSKNK